MMTCRKTGQASGTTTDGRGAASDPRTTSRSMTGPKPVTPSTTPLRTGQVPVSRPYRDAVQVEPGECASVKRDPFLANRSMCGVGIFDCGLLTVQSP